MPTADVTALAQLAPTGSLRVALNHANFLLVLERGPEASGIAPDLGRELARRLGVPVTFVGYEHAGLVADAAARNEWDVAFVGADPAREGTVTFSPAYVEIEATYLVPAGSAITTMAEVDVPGVRIAVAARSAYDLFLERSISRASLVRASGIAESRDLFLREQLEALAGLRPRLWQDVETIPGARILEGRFMAVQQAMGTPREREAAASYVGAFARDIVASGLVAELINRHAIRGLSVAARSP